MTTKYKTFMTNRSAFTLIELLVVMAIIGILVTVGLVSFRSSQARSRDAARKSDLKQISSSLELYYSDHGKYPPSNLIVPGQEFTDGKTTYFKAIPEDPAGGLIYAYRNPDSPDNQKFQLYAHLENSEDINCLPNLSGAPDCTNPQLPSSTVPNCGSGSVCNFSVTSPNTNPTE
jgi:prepilin-type N-terminal cleavage/methylation domain-containing protein